jgi:hypothetical protein
MQLRSDAQAVHELHFSGRGEIQKAALLDHRMHDRRVRHGLQCIVQIDSRQSLAQLPELHAHALAVEDEERRAELLDEPPDLSGLEGIDESCTADRAFHEMRETPSETDNEQPPGHFQPIKKKQARPEASLTLCRHC